LRSLCRSFLILLLALVAAGCGVHRVPARTSAATFAAPVSLEAHTFAVEPISLVEVEAQNPPPATGVFVAAPPSTAVANPIDPARRIDFTTAGADRTLMTATRPRCTTGTGTSVLAASSTAAQINTAISGCDAFHAVELAAGTFTLSTGLVFNNKNNVTLRGAGPDQTILNFTGAGSLYYPCLFCVGGAQGDAWSGAPNTATWDSGYGVGVTQIVVTRLTGSHVPATGEQIFTDQCNDGLSGASGNPSCGTGTASKGPDLAVCDQPQGLCSGDSPTDAGRQRRGNVQGHLITNVSGTGPYTIDITPGIYMPNISAARSPGAFWYNSAPIVGVGIEDLSARNTGVSTSSGGTFMFIHTHNSWIKHVRSLNTNNKHVKFHEGTHNTVRDTYFYGSPCASEAYGVDTYAGSDNLVENGIFIHISNPMMTEDCQGCVFAYNYSNEDCYDNATWQQGGGFYHHSVGNAFNLAEGNNAIGTTADDVHGSSNLGISFRNYYNGKDPGRSTSAQTNPVILNANSRYYSMVGNVLGTVGYHTTYQYDVTLAVNSGTCWHSIYSLGWGGNCAADAGYSAPDTLVKDSLMRWGDWDTVTSTCDNCANDQTGIRWDADKVPSGISPYGNPLPPTHGLPPSMYLSAKPSFFGADPWPGIGPDVSCTPGTNPCITNTGGHANKPPAQRCYEETMVDDPLFTAGTVKTFNCLY
jgi:hypothetical protein